MPRVLPSPVRLLFCAQVAAFLLFALIAFPKNWQPAAHLVSSGCSNSLYISRRRYRGALSAAQLLIH